MGLKMNIVERSIYHLFSTVVINKKGYKSKMETMTNTNVIASGAKQSRLRPSESSLSNWTELEVDYKSL
jgi:hypothetical protein